MAIEGGTTITVEVPGTAPSFPDVPVVEEPADLPVGTPSAPPGLAYTGLDGALLLALAVLVALLVAALLRRSRAAEAAVRRR